MTVIEKVREPCISLTRSGEHVVSRLDRILELFARYDSLAETGVESHNSAYGKMLLAELREERAKLTQELIEHGCRRKY